MRTGDDPCDWREHNDRGHYPREPLSHEQYRKVWRLMTTANDILRDAGITTKSAAPGRYYTICPKCSSKRKPEHRKLECLGITIDEKGVRWGCNHCDWKGGGFCELHSSTKNGHSYSPVIAEYIYRQ